LLCNLSYSLSQANISCGNHWMCKIHKTLEFHIEHKIKNCNFSLPVKVRSEKSLSNSLRELEINSWNSVVSGPAGEEWGEFRKPGEPGEREDLDEQGVRGDDWDEAALKERSLIAAPQAPDVMSSEFSCNGDKWPDNRWFSSASCSAALIIECICTKVFAKVLAGFLFCRGSSSSSSSTNIGELVRSAMFASTGTGNKGQILGAEDGGWGESSHDEAIGDGEPSESCSTPMIKRLQGNGG